MENHIKFEFFECSQFNGKNDIQRSVSILQDLGVVLATDRKEPKSPLQTLPYLGSATEYVNERYKEVELVDGDEVPIHLRRGPNHLSGAGLITKVIPTVNEPFWFVFDMFGKKFNMVAGSLITSSEFIDQCASFFLRVSSALYSILRPAFGLVDYAGKGDGDIFEEVPVRETKTLYWATFWGPEYVNKYGKYYFLNAPVWKKLELFDGGIFLQLHEHISSSTKSMERSKVKNYFSQIGVEHVSWPDK